MTYDNIKLCRTKQFKIFQILMHYIFIYINTFNFKCHSNEYCLKIFLNKKLLLT